ncbi:MAG: lamin tail domain-containing protein [Candidatus Cloacimonetes bacterium]|nr:lamin tail domain-containing protein [Candidatus Cloacimonadota bacterium]MDD4277676.1 lamin tail domain-containing protein [Candidatus Cloacimonadota bacterium]
MRIRLLFAAIAFCSLISARVVINEVCYDPAGADFGKEWIELYNASDNSVDLTGCKIYSGGTRYTKDFEFPYFVLRPHRFLLVGGSEVANAHFVHNFRFQNGGSASDGICFVNADSSYTDTVIYDSPNDNLLTDDTGFPASSCAEDAPEGCSLARVCDGWDTDQSAEDFIIESSPTPGLPNHVYADYALSDPKLTSFENAQQLQLTISNLSLYKPIVNAELLIYQDDQLLHSEEIAPLAFGEERIIEIWLQGGYHLLFAQLNLEDDPNLANNSLYISALGTEALPPLINEIFPAPLPGKQEWIELYAPAAASDRAEYVILDAANNRIPFSLPAVPGFFVLCRDRDALLADYPDCPPLAVIEVSSWASLNNDGDSLILFDAAQENVVDALIYTAAQAVSNMALQRIITADESIVWKVGTPNPGQDNTLHQTELPLHDEKLKIFGSPCDPRKAETIVISYNLPDPSNRINCTIYDLEGRVVRHLADHTLVEARGLLSWDGKRQNGSYAKRGLYVILWESQASSSGKVLRKQLSAVIR